MSKTIYVTSPSLPPLDDFIPYLRKIWDNKWLTNNGEFHKKFEAELAEYLGVKYVSLFTNGMIALQVGLQALLREISPISNFDDSFRLEFLDYTIGEPAISQHEAEHRSCTWHRPVNVRVRLHNDKL